MKNHAEIYQTLLDGKTIINKSIHIKVFLENGIQNKDQDWSFKYPDDWEILEEPALYYRWKRINSEYHQVDISEWVREKDNFEPDGWTRIEPGKTFEEIA